MLQRQKLWVPVLQHNPSFAKSFHTFLHNNPLTSLNAAALRLKPEDMVVALEPDPRNADKRIAVMLATTAKIQRSCCDDSSVTGAARGATDSAAPGTMSFGFATAVCDSMNSLHVMERLLPVRVAHVSVNIQAQLCGRAEQLSEGSDIVVVSSIDKMGKRLVYCQTEFFVEPAVVSPEQRASEQHITTTAELRRALQAYEKVVHATHVKSILSSSSVGTPEKARR